NQQRSILSESVRRKYKPLGEKTNEVIKQIADICKHKEKSNSWILWNERVHDNARTFDANTTLWKYLVTTDINKQKFMEETTIPELGVIFMMEVLV
ncbi:15234_t:CDS:2, partial [Cetraspora pellucida]